MKRVGARNGVGRRFVALGAFMLVVIVAGAVIQSRFLSMRSPQRRSEQHNAREKSSQNPTVPNAESVSTPPIVSPTKRDDRRRHETLCSVVGHHLTQGWSFETASTRAREWDAKTVAADFLLRQIPQSLVDQLRRYRSKALNKLQTRNAALWRRYFVDPWNVESCVSNYTPECAMMMRPDVFPEYFARDGAEIAEAHIDAVAHFSATFGDSGNLADASGLLDIAQRIVSHFNSSTDNFLLRKCCFEHRELRRALHFLFGHEAQHRNGSAWLTAGTLLGAVRERGSLIPWDTDVDVIVSPESASDVEKLVKSLAQRKHDTVPVPELYDEPLREPAAALLKKDHAHGHLLGVIYGTRRYFDEEASRVELWVRDESKKMQRRAINEPAVPCPLYDQVVWCPKDSVAVLEAGYGPKWCVPCKHKTSNCKGVLNVTSSS